MTFREDLLPCLDAIQEIAGAGCLDVRTNRLFVIERRTNTGNSELGSVQDCEVEVLPRPMIRERNKGRELIVKPVHQKYVDIIQGATTVSGGRDARDLNPDDRDGVCIVFRVEGPNAGEYTMTDFSAARPFRQVLILRRIPGETGGRLAHPQPQGTTNDSF